MNNFKVLIMEAADNTFTVSFTHPLTKKKTRKSFINQTEAQVYKKRLEEKFLKQNFEHFDDQTVEDLLIYFVQEKSKTPFSHKKVHLIDFIETFGDFKINDLNSKNLKIWLDQIQQENKLKDISMRGIKCEIDTFFSFLVEKEIISESPLKAIYYKKSEPPLKSRNILSKKQLQTLLEALRDYSPGYLYPLIKLVTETAIKASELIDLKWEQVDMDKGEIFFGKREKAQAKTLKISEEMIYMLRLKEKKKAHVFMTYYNEPFTYEKLRLAINEFKKKNLFDHDWTLMDLRHSYAVHFLSDGGGLRELSKLLGHYNVHETKRRYGAAVKAQIANDVVAPF